MAKKKKRSDRQVNLVRGRTLAHEDSFRGLLKKNPAILEEYLELLSKGGRLSESAKLLGISSRKMTRYRQQHPEFEAAVQEALEQYADKVRAAVQNRAIDGWDEPVFYEGAVCGVKRRFSDRLLELEAKARCAEYRDKSQVDVNVSGGVLVVAAPAPTEADWIQQHAHRSLPQAELEADSEG